MRTYRTALTKSELVYLRALEKAQTTGEIAQRLGVAKPSVSRALDNLHTKRLAVREEGGATLSAQGREVSAALSPCVEAIAAQLRECGFRKCEEIACGIVSSFGAETERLLKICAEG